MTSPVAVEVNVLVLRHGGVLSVRVRLVGEADLWPDAVAAAVATAWRLPGLAPDVIAVEPVLWHPISDALAYGPRFETPHRTAAGAWRN